MANPTKLDREILVLGAVVIVGMLLAILDATIVNVAIPTLGEDLHASISTIQWVMTGYLLAFASTIPLTGWASERFGVKRVWIASLLVFLAGSTLSGLAWSIDALIVSRVIQGAGAGLLMPVGQTILAQAAGPQRIGRVMSVIGVPLLLGPIFGPIIGGAIVGGASWRWIFFVNLPVGLVALALAWRLLPASAPRLGQRLDLRGLLLLSPGLALFVYGMAEAGSAGGFGGRALVGISAGLALVIVFVRHALQLGKAALTDVGLFRSRGFAAAAGTNLLVGIALFGALILLPLYSQLVRLFILVSGTVFVLAQLHPAKEEVSSSGPPPASGDPAHGQELFAENCASCHGEGGQGGGVGPTLAGNPISIADARSRIENGGGVMPANLVSGQDLADVLAYLQTILASG